MDERVKRLWNSGRTAIGGWALLPDEITTEIMAGQGFDIVTIDVQHLSLIHISEPTRQESRSRMPSSA